MPIKPPKNPKVLELLKSTRKRSHNLSFNAIRLEELNDKGKPKRLCGWCATKELLGGWNQKYCSTDCSESAMAYFYPQKEQALGFLLVKQDWKCAHCSYDYKSIIQGILSTDKARYPSTPDLPLDSLPWYYLKRLKRNTSKEHKPEVDHILAISKGGDSLGLDNHQVLCYSCHKKKTKNDLSGKRTK